MHHRGVRMVQVLEATRAACEGFAFDGVGIAHADGRISPFPDESGALGVIMETALLSHLEARLPACAPGVRTRRAPNSRTYPDLDIEAMHEDGPIALDIKTARLTPRGDRLASRIGLGPFDRYFRRPTQLCAGCLRPYGQWVGHVVLVVAYAWDPAGTPQVGHQELIVAERWRVASRRRASSTRAYMGSVTALADLRAGRGDFADASAFEAFWRASA